MHNTAAYGIAAHWKYKQGMANAKLGTEEAFEWVRKLLETSPVIIPRLRPTCLSSDSKEARPVAMFRHHPWLWRVGPPGGLPQRCPGPPQAGGIGPLD